MDYTIFILKECVPVAAALYVLGVLLKKSRRVKDWQIIFALLGLSPVLVFGVLYIRGGVIIDIAFVGKCLLQGILCTGCAVLLNQSVKQAKEGIGETSENRQFPL